MSQGLCNGTRLRIVKLYNNYIEAKIISDIKKAKVNSDNDETVKLFRVTLEANDPKNPKFTRHQFPIRLAFAMFINKSQGQTLENVGLYLIKDTFAHGQLYVGMSRAMNRNSIKILLNPDKDQNTATNKVYKEVLNNEIARNDSEDSDEE